MEGKGRADVGTLLKEAKIKKDDPLNMEAGRIDETKRNPFLVLAERRSESRRNWLIEVQISVLFFKHHKVLADNEMLLWCGIYC